MPQFPSPAQEWCFSLQQVRGSLSTGCRQAPWQAGAPTQNQGLWGNLAADYSDRQPPSPSIWDTKENHFGKPDQLKRRD